MPGPSSVRFLSVLTLSALAAASVACSASDSPTIPGGAGATQGANPAQGGSGSGNGGTGGAGGTLPDGGPSGPNGGGDDVGGDDAGSTSPDGGHAAPDAGPGGAGGTEFAPYFPTWVWGGSGYAFTSLVDLQKKAGVNQVTLAFVLADNGCKADQGIEQNIGDVKAFLAAGGYVKASFGGADGTYVESQCADAASLAKALSDFVDATGITDLDFDIEQDAVLTDAVNDLRGKALKMVQDAKGIKVAFTLAANPDDGSGGGGMATQGKSVVSHAVAAGVKVSHVNMMTMDYGDEFQGKPMAPVAIGSLTDLHTQLLAIVPGLSAADGWAMVGVIPMIGKNDDAEVFSIDDAKSLVKFATDQKLGLVSFWSIDRDQTCQGGADFNTCSTVDTTNFQFASILKTVAQ